METEAVAAVAAAIVAAEVSFVALPFAVRAADAAKAQTELQLKVAQDSAQPSIWVDIAGDPQQGQMLKLVLGNAGPTLATDARVEISPDLPAGGLPYEAREVVAIRLKPGIQSLAPGGMLKWPIGLRKKVLADDGHQIFSVTIDATGPFGPIPTLTYDIDLADFRKSSDMPEGSLHHIRKVIDELAKKLDSGDS